MSSPSLRPLIDTCQKCATSPANHEPRSPANGSFQNPGVCPQAVPSFPSPTPTVLFLALAPFSAQAKYRKPFFAPKLYGNACYAGYFGISLFVFCIMQIRKRRFVTKMLKYWLKNLSGNIEAVFFILGTRNVHLKRNIEKPVVSWQQFCH